MRMQIALVTFAGLVVAAAQDPKPESDKQKQCRVTLGHLTMGLRLYREFTGAWPKTLGHLVDKPKDASFWPEGGYLAGGKLPKDPWGRDFLYDADGALPRISSLGADGKKGGTGEDEDLDHTRVFANDDAKRIQCQHLIDNLTMATKIYELDNNAYPASGNASLVTALSSAGPKKLPYFEFVKGMLNDKGEVLDPWGRPLVYANNAVNYPGNMEDKKARNKTSFDIHSFGADGKDGTADDPNNWE